MSFDYVLVTDAASRGFLVLSCHLATACDRPDAALRAFLVLTCSSVGAILSADPENPTVEPNMKWIGRPLAEIWPFEISPVLAK